MRNPQAILITGASSGLGKALALTYAERGVSLHLCARNAERLREVATACEAKGAAVYSAIVDVTNNRSMTSWILSADEKTPLDLVIANAGISAGTADGNESEDQVRDIFTTNLAGTLNTFLPIIPKMQWRRKGQLAIISSLAGYRGLPSAPAYSASKGAQKLYGEALRPFLAPYGVHVNVVCPGFIKTPLTDVNRFKMPFLMEADKAAEVIKRGLASNKPRIAFPAPMRFGSTLLSILPIAMSDSLTAMLPKKG